MRSLHHRPSASSSRSISRLRSPLGGRSRGRLRPTSGRRVQRVSRGRLRRHDDLRVEVRDISLGELPAELFDPLPRGEDLAAAANVLKAHAIAVPRDHALSAHRRRQLVVGMPGVARDASYKPM